MRIYPRSQNGSRLEDLQTGESKLSIHRLKIDGLGRSACHPFSSPSGSYFSCSFQAVAQCTQPQFQGPFSTSKHLPRARTPWLTHTVFWRRLQIRLGAYASAPLANLSTLSGALCDSFEYRSLRLCQSWDASFSHPHHNSPCHHPLHSWEASIRPKEDPREQFSVRVTYPLIINRVSTSGHPSVQGSFPTLSIA